MGPTNTKTQHLEAHFWTSNISILQCRLWWSYNKPSLELSLEGSQNDKQHDEASIFCHPFVCVKFRYLQNLHVNALQYWQTTSSIDLEIDFMVMTRLVGDNRETDMVTWWDPLLSLPLGNNGRDQQWFQRCSRHFVSLSFPPSSWRTIERGFIGPLHTKAKTTAFIGYSREAQYHGFNNKTINISHIHKEDIKYQMCLTNLKPVDEFNLACLALVGPL